MKSGFGHGLKALALALLCFSPCSIEAIGDEPGTGWSAGARLEVQLKLSAKAGKDGHAAITGELVITNPGTIAVTVQQPTNRRVVAFFVSDDLGNPVAPEGLSKVDPSFETLTLAAGGSFTHPLDSLEFLTGSILREYPLEAGKSYRVVAVYRPAGASGPGFTSQEVELKVPQ